MCLVFVASVVAVVLAYDRIGRIDCDGIRTGGDTVRVSQSASLLPASVPETAPLLALSREYDARGVVKFLDEAPSYNLSSVLDKFGLGFYVLENNAVNWNQLEQLDIFSNPEFNGEKLIAPGTAGSYYFTIKNNALFEITAKLVIADINEWDIPMKFRLRTNYEYIYGGSDTWLTSEEFATKVMKVSLPAKTEQNYIIDWQWVFYEDHQRDLDDTYLGNAAYYHYAERVYEYDFNGDGVIGAIDSEDGEFTPGSEPEVKYTLLLSIYAEQTIEHVDFDYTVEDNPMDIVHTTHEFPTREPTSGDQTTQAPPVNPPDDVTTGEDISRILIVVLVFSALVMLGAAFIKLPGKDEDNAGA